MSREIVDVLEELVTVLKDVRRELRRDVLAKDFYTVSEAAKYLKVSDYTIRRWIKEGKIHSEKPGNGKTARHRIPRSELERLAGKK